MNRRFEGQTVEFGVEPGSGAVGEAYQLPFSFCTGWDPYEIWCTRIRVKQLGADAKVPFRAPAVRPIPVPAWPILLLALALGLNRELVGIFRVDLIGLLFGVMTPAARAVHVLLGFATIWAVVVALRPAGRHVGTDCRRCCRPRLACGLVRAGSFLLQTLTETRRAHPLPFSCDPPHPVLAELSTAGKRHDAADTT